MTELRTAGDRRHRGGCRAFNALSQMMAGRGLDVPDVAPGSIPPSVRAQLLVTEHWSLLATRSTTQSEVLSRITMFLMLLSASIIGLGLIGQLTRFDARFVGIAFGSHRDRSGDRRAHADSRAERQRRGSRARDRHEPAAGRLRRVRPVDRALPGDLTPRRPSRRVADLQPPPGPERLPTLREQRGIHHVPQLRSHRGACCARGDGTRDPRRVHRLGGSAAALGYLRISATLLARRHHWAAARYMPRFPTSGAATLPGRRGPR